MKVETIVFATDYSPASQHALAYAASLAKDYGARLIVAHVTHEEEQPVGELFEDAPPPNPEKLAELRSVAPSDASIRCEHRLLHATSPHEGKDIVNLAKQENAQLIVLGTHGRKGFGHLLMGSVAEEVARTAPCPVLTVRQRADERQIAE